MFDYVQFQDDLTMCLLSAKSLLTVPVKSYYRMRLAKEVDFRTMLLMGRGSGSPVGSGILVGEPSARCASPAVTGVILTWTFPIACIYCPQLADDPTTGTLLNDAALVQRVCDVLQLYADDNAGTLKVAVNTAEPEREYVFDGCRGQRVNLEIIAKSTQTVRCARVTASFAGHCTLSCGTLGAEVCFTLDGSFPARVSMGINPASMLYTAPFAVASGTIIRAAAYLDGLMNSPISAFTAP